MHGTAGRDASFDKIGYMVYKESEERKEKEKRARGTLT